MITPRSFVEIQKNGETQYELMQLEMFVGSRGAQLPESAERVFRTHHGQYWSTEARRANWVLYWIVPTAERQLTLQVRSSTSTRPHLRFGRGLSS